MSLYNRRSTDNESFDGDSTAARASMIRASVILLESLREALADNTALIDKLEAQLQLNGERISSLTQELDVLHIRYIAATEEVLTLRSQLRALQP